MRVGFIGNANNYPFPLAQAMREQGVDVRFLVTSRSPLDRPECRFGEDAVDYSTWAFDVAPMRTWDSVLPTAKRATAERLLRSCDGIVANGYGIALAARLNKPLFVVSTGSDLDMLANRDYLEQIAEEGREGPRSWLRARVKTWLYGRLVPVQREGFRRAVGLEYAPPGILPHGDALLKEIGLPDERRYAFMLTDLEKVRKTPLPNNERLRILCLARLNWCEPLPPGFSVLDNKRNDILLRGVAEFRRRNPIPLELCLVTKGLHVPETRALVEELGLSDCVTWLPEMTQAEFSDQIVRSDIVADHFGEGAIGMGARDSIAMGRPLIANGKPDIYIKYLGEPLPLVDANTPEDVASALELLKDVDTRQRYADQARAFAERHFSASAAAATILKLLRSA